MGDMTGGSTGSFLQRVEVDADVLGPPDEAALNAVGDAVGDAVEELSRTKMKLKRTRVELSRTKGDISREKACRAVTLS